jgi:hypothetical protein
MGKDQLDAYDMASNFAGYSVFPKNGEYANTMTKQDLNMGEDQL